MMSLPSHDNSPPRESEPICECGRRDEEDFHALDCPRHPFAVFPEWKAAVERDINAHALSREEHHA